MTTDPVLQDLLDDAVKVASYGQRTGKLASSDLFEAIRKAKAKEDLVSSDPETVALQTALAQAVKAIEPITLIDLRRWDPFSGKRRSGAYKGAFVLVTLILILFCGNYTSVYNEAAAYGAALEEVKESRLNELLTKIVSQLDAQVGTTDGTEAPAEDRLGQVLIYEIADELRSMDLRISKYVPLALDLAYSQRYFVGWTRTSYTLAPQAQKATANLCALSAEGLAQLKTSMEQGGQSVLGAKKAAWVAKLIADRDETVFGIKCSFHLEHVVDNLTFGASFDGAILAMKEIVTIFGLWILPLAYGALGATVYFMRAVLNPLEPDPELAKIGLRIMLGAFAGLAVGWLWSPLSQGAPEFKNLGLSVFTVAFLFGFSIDVFFALLDRLVTVSSNAIGKIGAS